MRRAKLSRNHCAERSGAAMWEKGKKKVKGKKKIEKGRKRVGVGDREQGANRLGMRGTLGNGR